jgi:aspartate carbamoyltransferase catalytic subunit
MKHVLSADQFDQKELRKILREASEMEVILNKGGSEMARGKILATLFYEPSTRTRLSFESAMLRLGGRIISETDVHFSSAIKGEVLADTARIVGGYSDIIAIRSKNVGDAKILAERAGVPVINGGDGSAEHPTQGLLDLYTIGKHFDLGHQEITISFVGELVCARTVHSCSQLLRNFPGIKFQFVAPEEIQIPDKYFDPSRDKKFFNLSDEILKNSDVIYDTRIQKERLDPIIYEKHKNAFHFDVGKVQHMKKSAILMHPLPRVNEIAYEVDALPQAKYFEQAQNGVPVRMALIARGLGLI